MRPGACIHYRVEAGEMLCGLGIDIEATFKPRAPCWTGNNPAECSATCDRFQAPTAEQLAAHRAEGEAACGRMLQGLVAADRWIEAQPKPHALPLRGATTCPVCGKRLEVLLTARRLYATCETARCVNFSGQRARR